MLTKEEGRKKLPEVIERFKRWKAEGRLNNEEDVKDLIHELSEKVLGWDRDDIYRERHPGPTSKRADFQFKDKGITKLILETKAINVSWDKSVIRQAVGYGWGANKEYVVLTNFESIILFNAKWKDENKKIFEIENIEDCQKFPDKFDRLWLLSKNSFLTGQIDRFSEDIGKKLKKASISTVDKQLLNDLKKWRETLTRDIKILNELSKDKINDIVQKIINRLIFIRVCEDKGLEPGYNLRSHLNIWSEKKNKSLMDVLVSVFHRYDDVYDGTIFQKNDPCEKVKIHNDILEKIINELYVAKDLNVEYNFAHIDADILGSVYEEYLGYLLKGKKITKNHIHRKEQGIYYTPTYIVDYIVRNTLGELLKNKKIDAEKIKILDPACGSGSFLIKAFDILNEYYSKNDKNYNQKTLAEDGTTYSIKERILKSNIFGVDLDKQAVEIAQLNLLLKIAKGGHRLPLLQKNIKCGNSLIDDTAIARNKAFKWEEKFKKIMQEGKFDVVIGNPPYGAELKRYEFNYFKQKYISAEYKIDTFGLFIERGLDLLKDGGYFGFIIPNTILTNKYFQKLRKKILKECQIITLLEFGYYVFQDAKIDNLIIILKKESNQRKRASNKIISAKIEKPVKSLLSLNFEPKIKQEEFSKDIQSRFIVHKKGYTNLLSKIKNNCEGRLLGQLVNINLGFRVRSNKELVHTTKHEGDVPILHGRDINFYGIKFQNRYFTYRKQDIVGGCSKREVYEADEKLLIQAIRNIKLKKRVVCAYDNSQFFVIGGLLSVTKKSPDINLKYLLALLNSRLLNFYFRSISIDKNIKVVFLKQLPIKQPKSSDEKEIIKLVDKILSFSKRLNEISNEKTNEKTGIKEEINKIDSKINDLVYKIYGINEEERRIVENTFK